MLAACSSDGGRESVRRRRTQPSTSGGCEPGASKAPTGFAACGNQESGDGLADRRRHRCRASSRTSRSTRPAGAARMAGATAVGGTARGHRDQGPADYATNIQTFIDQGYEIIVTFGFAMGNATTNAAKANPDIKFIGVDQFVCVDENGDSGPDLRLQG